MKGNRNVSLQMMVEATSESGDRWSRYCVIDSRGVIVKEDRVRTSPESLEETLRIMQSSKIGIEAGTHSPLGEPAARTAGTPGDRGQRPQSPSEFAIGDWGLSTIDGDIRTGVVAGF